HPPRPRPPRVQPARRACHARARGPLLRRDRRDPRRVDERGGDAHLPRAARPARAARRVADVRRGGVRDLATARRPPLARGARPAAGARARMLGVRGLCGASPRPARCAQAPGTRPGPRVPELVLRRWHRREHGTCVEGRRGRDGGSCHRRCECRDRRAEAVGAARKGCTPDARRPFLGAASAPPGHSIVRATGARAPRREANGHGTPSSIGGARPCAREAEAFERLVVAPGRARRPPHASRASRSSVAFACARSEAEAAQGPAAAADVGCPRQRRQRQEPLKPRPGLARTLARLARRKERNMSIFNRRNATFGWVVWMALKTFARQKARQAVPGRGDYAGLNKGALASTGATALAAFAALVFWRKKPASPAAGSE